MAHNGHTGVIMLSDHVTYGGLSKLEYGVFMLMQHDGGFYNAFKHDNETKRVEDKVSYVIKVAREVFKQTHEIKEEDKRKKENEPEPLHPKSRV